MKYRYLVVSLDGVEPEGTDDRELAQQFADENEQCWVIDTETGMTLDEDPVDIEEVRVIDPEDDPDEVEDTGEVEGNPEREDPVTDD